MQQESEEVNRKCPIDVYKLNGKENISHYIVL